MLSDFEREIAFRNVKVITAPDFPEVFADLDRLLQVLQNLVSNALRFASNYSPPEIEIGWRKTDGELRFFVRDNGVGVDPINHENIFNPFYRIEHLDDGGAGIGLALVKLIIEQHNGRLWVESEGLGGGATFWFTLPASNQEQT